MSRPWKGESTLNENTQCYKNEEKVKYSNRNKLFSLYNGWVNLCSFSYNRCSEVRLCSDDRKEGRSEKRPEHLKGEINNVTCIYDYRRNVKCNIIFITSKMML